MFSVLIRWNGFFFTIVMLLMVCTSIDKWMLFYIYLGVIEIIMYGHAKSD